MRTSCQNSVNVTTNLMDSKYNLTNYNQSHNNAIPYHARENSLPFSYGKIEKTPISMRNIIKTQNEFNNYNIDKTRKNLDISFDNARGVDVGIPGGSFIGNNSPNRNLNLGQDLKVNSINNETDGPNIQTHSRLTSPLLVRKTLANTILAHSSNTSKISDVYSMNVGVNGVNHKGRKNGNTGYYEYESDDENYKYFADNNGNVHASRKTPIRDDFEKSLRACRDKVFNDFNSNSNEKFSVSKTTPPEPPLRQHTLFREYANGSLKSYSNELSPIKKYNFDIEFNLNLDDVDLTAAAPKRSQTMQRELLKNYCTEDIPNQTSSSTFLEGNYHTISAPFSNSRKNSSTKEIEKGQSTLDGKKLNLSNKEIIHYLQNSGNSPLSPENQNYSLLQKHQMQQNEEHFLPSVTYSNATISTKNDNNSDKYWRDNVDKFAKREIPDLRSCLSDSPIYATSRKETETIQNIRLNRSQNEEDDSHNFYNSITSNMTSTPPFGTRSETPAFPITPQTPVSVLKHKNGAPQCVDSEDSLEKLNNNEAIYQSNYRAKLSSSLSMSNSEPQEVAAHLVKFAKDSSKFWYKPHISREEAITLLLNTLPGTFLIRDSTTFKNAFGLVLRVAQFPPGTTSNKPDELVRHFLIEPTTRGVRLKGCPNEPIFTSLSALVYEHSINRMALPLLLRIPEKDVIPPLVEPTPAQKQLLTQGAACNVLWLYSCDTESLTGEEAVRKAVRQMFAQKSIATPTEVHFKVSKQGITLTDNTRKMFFRKHYAADMISFCAVDPDHRLWTFEEVSKYNNTNKKATVVGVTNKTIFAFVARRSPTSNDNQCHVFCDLEFSQPASAIVSFASKTLPIERQKNYFL